MDKIGNLETRLADLDKGAEGNENEIAVISEKRERLERIRHGLTELNDRMQRPYVVSAELQAVKEVFGCTFAEVGECNSVILKVNQELEKPSGHIPKLDKITRGCRSLFNPCARQRHYACARFTYSIDDVRRLSDAQAQAQVPEQIRQEAAIMKQKFFPARRQILRTIKNTLLSKRKCPQSQNLEKQQKIWII